MKIAIITGPRQITAQDEQLVRNVIREIISRNFQLYVGDAVGTDNTVVSEISPFADPQTCWSFQKGNGSSVQIFRPHHKLGRTPAGLAERSTRMVKEALAQACGRGCFHDEIICVGFPNRACPAGIVPARTWRSGNDEGSGTWSTLALAVGHGIYTVMFPISGCLPGWPGWHGYAEQLAKDFFLGNLGGWEWRPFEREQSNIFEVQS